MQKKKLPVGIQDFPRFKEGNYLYVDKTEYIHRIVTNGDYYFLSRPRRFGKSLLISTMKELFSGNRALFEGLWIENRWDWSITNPVVHISFAAAGFREIGLIGALESIINSCAREHNIELTEKSYALRFKELLAKLHAQQGKVVILIDEYDKPIVDYIDNVVQAHKNKEILKDFYVVLKDTPQYVKFVFITGISKFSKVSIFSALNHLNDISLNDDYATLVGYTQADIEHHFKEYIPIAAQKNDVTDIELLTNLKHWYNGYSWDAKNFVYNPFSVLKFFSENTFRNHWFSTGTPTFLSVLARQQEFYDLDEVETEQTAFDTFDIEHLDAQAVMFQTGYLTIKKHDLKSGIYTLGYPNNEVRRAFLEFMIEAYSNVIINQIPPTFIKIRRALDRKDMETVIELINTMFSSIPSPIFDGTSEKYFHSLVHLMLHYLGTNIESEINTNKGRIDSVLYTPQYIYILEFKFNKSAEEALNAIHSRGYAEKYAHNQKEVVAVGINFSSKTKGINDWKMVNL